MDYINPDALVSAAWLNDNLDTPNIRILDCTHFALPGRDADEEFEEEHIPGAVRFDIDTICNKDHTAPHMLPSADLFAAEISKLGIGNEDHVICYDSVGVATAACRAWWMFRVFGHAKVSVLDGGFPMWLRQGFDVEGGIPEPVETNFTAHLNLSMVRDIDQIVANIDSQAEQVLDARSKARFDGEDPEPRPTKRLGHIPGNISMPFLDIMNPREMAFLEASDIRAAFENAGVDLEKPIVATCGSGVTACVLALGLYLIGRTDIPVYDGSWAEWNERLDLPFEAKVGQAMVE